MIRLGLPYDELSEDVPPSEAAEHGRSLPCWPFAFGDNLLIFNFIFFSKTLTLTPFSASAAPLL